MGGDEGTVLPATDVDDLFARLVQWLVEVAMESAPADDFDVAA
jgi:hypothetical protein